MKHSIIAKREDGFKISYTSLNDFIKLKKLVSGLSNENKCLFTPWLFSEKPNFKVRIGQLLAKCSLITSLGKIIKKIFPRGYIIILKLESPDDEVVGFVFLYNFKKLSDQYFYVTLGYVVADNYQGMGLGTFQCLKVQNILSTEKIRCIEANVFIDNKKSGLVFKKMGFETEGIEKNILQPCGKRHDVIKFVKNFKIQESQSDDSEKNK